MNIDLLTKLVRLANNNPNDNEANLAARKVCKMIESSNFKFNNSKPVPNQVKSTTWNDVKRSEEPQWKSTPQEPNYSAQEKWFREFFEQRKKEQERWARNTYKEPPFNPFTEPWVQEPPIYEAEKSPPWKKESKWENPIDLDNRGIKWHMSDYDYNPVTGQVRKKQQEYEYDSITGRAKKKQREKRPLNCSRCGKEFQTAFVGPPQVFTCNGCHWKEYKDAHK